MHFLDSDDPLTLGTALDMDFVSSPSLCEDCDVVELRLDHIHAEGEAPDPLTLPQQLPYLITARGPEEGGANSLTARQRKALYEAYLPQAAAIDLEAVQLDYWQDWLKEMHSQHDFALIASNHHFKSPPSLGTCEGLAEQAFAAGADLMKFAFRVDSLSDIQLGLDLLELNFPGPIAVMGMGPLAPVSRLLYAQHGSRLNYGYLGQTEAAPGQWPAGLLKAGIAHLQKIDPKAR